MGDLLGYSSLHREGTAGQSFRSFSDRWVFVLWLIIGNLTRLVHRNGTASSGRSVLRSTCICSLDERKLTDLSHRSRLMSPGGSISFNILCNRCLNHDYLSWNPIIRVALFWCEAILANPNLADPLIYLMSLSIAVIVALEERAQYVRSVTKTAPIVFHRFFWLRLVASFPATTTNVPTAMYATDHCTVRPLDKPLLGEQGWTRLGLRLDELHPLRR